MPKFFEVLHSTFDSSIFLSGRDTLVPPVQSEILENPLGDTWQLATLEGWQQSGHFRIGNAAVKCAVKQQHSYRMLRFDNQSKEMQCHVSAQTIFTASLVLAPVMSLSSNAFGAITANACLPCGH